MKELRYRQLVEVSDLALHALQVAERDLSDSAAVVVVSIGKTEEGANLIQ